MGGMVTVLDFWELGANIPLLFEFEEELDVRVAEEYIVHHAWMCSYMRLGS